MGMATTGFTIWMMGHPSPGATPFIEIAIVLFLAIGFSLSGLQHAIAKQR